MSKFDTQYLKLCKEILENGKHVPTRTGIDVLKLPHYVMQFDLAEEFPILTTKFVAFKSAVLEMLWIYQAQSNDVRWLQDRGVKIWNEWAVGEDGTYAGRDFGVEFAHTIGTAYGYVVKYYGLMDRLLNDIKNHPYDRRKVMSLWQEELIKTATLPSCVWASQWDVTDGKLNCLVTQRSCDVALGLPFNVTQYAVLQSMLAHVSGLEVGKLTWVINDAHIYVNQIEGIVSQLEREKYAYPAPKLWLNPEIKDFYQFDSSAFLKDIHLVDYQHHQKIKMPIAV